MPVFLWATVIFSLSSIPQVTVSGVFLWDYIVKKIAHVSEYSIFYILTFRANSGNWLLSFLATIIYAASDEIHQSFVPGRTAAFYDLIFDFCGASIAAYIIWKLPQLRRLILNN